MTILNVDEIEKYDIENLNPDGIDKYGLTKQPTIYNSSEELIKWLKYDLLQQALRRNKKPDENNIITITDEEEKDYILNIGREVWDINYYINIYFDFSLYDLQVLLYGNKDNIKDNYRINTDYIIFHKEADFYNSKNYYRFRGVTFHEKVSFYEHEFIEEMKFDNVIFYKEVNFFEALFHKELSFSRTYFYDDVDLSCFFYDKVSFYGITIKKEMYFGTLNEKINTIIFSGIILENQKSILHIGSINKVNNFSFVNTAINGQLELNNIEIEKADFKGSIINSGILNLIDLKINHCTNSETARFLKNDAYQKYNYIKALEYQAEETRLHKEELKEKFKKDKNIKNFGDILSIELSSIYSDNGQNWVKAFICTILFPSVFFTLLYIDFKVGLYFYILLITYIINILFSKDILKYIINSILVYLIACLLLPLLYIEINNFDKTYIKELFIFLVPTNFEQIKESIYIYNNNTLFRGFNYFIGKIAFWYGSVQTVTAFRKFAKGA